MNLKEHINELVTLQRKLLTRFKEVVDTSLINEDGDLSIFARKNVTSHSFEIDEEKWVMRFHGVGVCFTRLSDKVEVDFDKHLNKPNSFSDWRLHVYLESLGIKQDYNELKITLRTLGLKRIENGRYELSKQNA